MDGFSKHINENTLSSAHQWIIDGYLHGAAFYVLAYISKQELFVSFVSPQTMCEFFAIPKIINDSYLFSPGDLFAQFVDPKIALCFALSQYEPDLLAMENIFRIFKVEDGSFSYIYGNRSVQVWLKEQYYSDYCARKIIVIID